MRFKEFINEGWIETSTTKSLKKYLETVKGIRKKTKLAIEAELRKRQGQSQNINTSDKLKPSVDVNKHIIPGIIKSYLNKDTMVDASGNKIEPTQIDEYDFDKPLTHESTDDFDGRLKSLSELLPDTNYGALYFKGVFALEGLEGQDLGKGRRQHTYIPRKNLIADHGSWDIDEEKAIELIKNEYPDANEEQLYVIKRVAINEKSIWDIVEAEYDGENILSELMNIDPDSRDDLGEVDWMLQGLRGQIAADQGFDAIKMRDEHGTSYLIPIGSKALYLGQIKNWDEYEEIVNRLKGTKTTNTNQ